MEPKWKDVSDFKGLYSISNSGLVKSFHRNGVKILKPGISTYGYEFVVLQKNGYKKTKLIHQLVIENFSGKCPEGMQVNHKDGNKRNNDVKNLEYVTPRENTIHAIEVLGKKRSCEHHWKSKITQEQVDKMRKLYKTGKYVQTELGKMFGIHRGQVSKICNHKSWVN